MQLHSLTDILKKRMGRQEFLRTIGLAALALVGLGFFVKGIGAPKNPGTSAQAGTIQPSQSSDSYGK